MGLKRAINLKKFDIVLTASILIIYFIVFYTPFMYFKDNPNKLIVGEDIFPLFNYDCAKYAYTWYDLMGSGIYNSWTGLLPHSFGVWLLSKIFTFSELQLVIIALLVYISFFSFYFLVKEFLLFTYNKTTVPSEQKNRYIKISSTLAAFIYVFNPFFALEWYLGHVGIIRFHAFLPIIFLCFFKFIVSENYSWLILMVLVSLAAVPGPDPILVVWIFLVISFGMCSSIFLKIDKVKLIKSISLFLIIFFLGNLWWILPYYYGGLVNPAVISTKFSPDWYYKFSTKFSTLLELFRLLGEGNFYQHMRFPISNYYLNSVITLISYSIVCISFSVLLLGGFRLNKRLGLFVTFFSVLFLLSLFIIKGFNFPFGNINLWLFEHFWIFMIFRAPWKRFMLPVVFSLSILFAFSLIELLIKFYNIYKKKESLNLKFTAGIIFVVILVLCLYSYPIVSGELFKIHGIPSVPGSVKVREYPTMIPKYIHSTSNYLNDQSEKFKIIIFPFDPFYASFQWGYCGGWDFIADILNRPLVNIVGVYGLDSKFMILWKNSLEKLYNNSTLSFYKYANLFNVKYVLIFNDWDMNYIGGFIKRISPNKIRKYLLDSGFVIEKKIGKVIILRNKYWNQFQIFSTPNAIFVNKDINIINTITSNNSAIDWTGMEAKPLSFPTIISNLKVVIQIEDNPILHTLDLTNLTRLKKNENLTPILTFKKINPTKYIVSVKNATSPFFLVFSESYHPKWKAYVKTENRKRKMGNGKWEIIAEYPKIHVKEARHEMKFTPKDISYLFKKPLPEKYHLLVNGYANAWYIDPKEIGSSNFTITLYFWPQSLFYLGLFISGTTLLGCLGYLGLEWKRKLRK